jgi:hypothetical protein
LGIAIAYYKRITMWQTIHSSFLAWALIKCSNKMLTLELKLIFFSVEVVASLGSKSFFFFFVGPFAQKIPNERHHMKIGTK